MKLNRLLSAAAVAVTAAGAAHAATQGALGATSTGTITVTMDILEQVKVSNLADIALGQYVPGGGDLTGSSDVCVHYNNATNYDLTLSSANSAGPGFQLANAGNFVTYAVDYTTKTTAGGGATAAHIEAATVQYDDADPNADDCVILTGPTSTLDVTVTDTGTTLGVPNGTYSDVITLVVAPKP